MAAALHKTTITLSEAAVLSGICFGFFMLCLAQAVLAGFPEASAVHLVEA